MKVIAAVILFALALFCGYGLLASFEPGTAVAWKVGYAAGTIAFFAASMLVLRKPRRIASGR